MWYFNEIYSGFLLVLLLLAENTDEKDAQNLDKKLTSISEILSIMQSIYILHKNSIIIDLGICNWALGVQAYSM